MSDALKQRIVEDMKAAMRARDKERLAAIRLITAALKQVEVDERVASIDDVRTLAVLQKMLKQRRDSIAQYTEANRQDLADREAFEVAIIESYLPQPLSDAELEQLVESVLKDTGAESMRDMGKVMAKLKDRVKGRAEMGAVSAKVKNRLASSS